MEIESVDRKCILCGDDAVGRIKKEERSIELCANCAKEVLWQLTHNAYPFEED